MLAVDFVNVKRIISEYTNEKYFNTYQFMSVGKQLLDLKDVVMDIYLRYLTFVCKNLLKKTIMSAYLKYVSKWACVRQFILL